MKTRSIAASLIAASALALGFAAQAEQEDALTHQLNRWGVPATPENIARYHAERGGYYGAYPYGYQQGMYPNQGNIVWHNGVPIQLATPPNGYVWQPYGGDNYALINQITGAIAQILRVR